MYVEEPWKGSVPEVHQKRTTDGSDLKVIDPNISLGKWESPTMIPMFTIQTSAEIKKYPEPYAIFSSMEFFLMLANINSTFILQLVQ